MKISEDVIDILGAAIAPATWRADKVITPAIEYDRESVRRHVREGVEALGAAGYVIVRNEPPPGWSDWAWRDLLIQMTCFPSNTKKAGHPEG